MPHFLADSASSGGSSSGAMKLSRILLKKSWREGGVWWGCGPRNDKSDAGLFTRRPRCISMQKCHFDAVLPVCLFVYL